MMSYFKFAPQATEHKTVGDGLNFEYSGEHPKATQNDLSFTFYH